MEIFAFWVLISIGAAMLAARYNRNPIGWFILSVLLSPIVGFVFLLALGPLALADYKPTTGNSAPAAPVAEPEPVSIVEAYRSAEQTRMAGRMW
jgi:hypothetical protein